MHCERFRIDLLEVVAHLQAAGVVEAGSQQEELRHTAETTLPTLEALRVQVALPCWPEGMQRSDLRNRNLDIHSRSQAARQEVVEVVAAMEQLLQEAHRNLRFVDHSRSYRHHDLHQPTGEQSLDHESHSHHGHDHPVHAAKEQLHR